VNVTEGCKSEGYWLRIRDNHLDLSAYGKQVIQHWQEHPVKREQADGTAREDAEAVERVVARGAPTWLALARWGREKAEPARHSGHRRLGDCPGHQQPEAAVREAGGGGGAGTRRGEKERVQDG
jgi:hypothetical protein